MKILDYFFPFKKINKDLTDALYKTLNSLDSSTALVDKYITILEIWLKYKEADDPKYLQEINDFILLQAKNKKQVEDKLITIKKSSCNKPITGGHQPSKKRGAPEPLRIPAPPPPWPPSTFKRSVPDMPNIPSPPPKRLDWCGNVPDAPNIPPPPPEPAITFIIISKKHGFVGNCFLMWATDSRGYTTNLKNAELYTEEEAVKICQDGDDFAIPFRDAQNKAIQCLDANYCSQFDRKIE